MGSCLRVSIGLLLACACLAAKPSPYRFRTETFPRYELEIKLDPEHHRLQGSGTISIPASPQTRNSVGLSLAPSMRDFTVEVLEPKESAGPAALEPVAKPQGDWTIRPSKVFPANRAVKLSMKWQGGEKSSFVFYLGTEGSFASGINTNWYPEYTEQNLATGRLHVVVPAGLTVHANGVRKGTEQERARGEFTYESFTPGYFTFVAANYTVARRDGPVPVSVYLLKPRSSIDEYVDGSRKAIQDLSEEFGPYPSGEFAIVETPAMQSVAAGFSGASVTGFIMATTQFLDQRYNLAYYGHEIAHQWWGNLIRHSGQSGNMMLDEALAQYGSLRVVETLDSAAAAEQYRRTGYPGYIPNQSGIGYLRVLASGKDFPLASIPRDASRTLPDGKGFQVWDLLSRTVGRDNFRRILRDFTSRHAFQSVTWDEFLQAVERGSGRDLQWFYQQWFERTGVPDWKLSWRQEGQTVRGEITQAPPYFRATIEVEAESTDGQKKSAMFEVDGPKTAFELPVKFAAKTVILDPHFQVLHWTPEYREAVARSSTK